MTGNDGSNGSGREWLGMTGSDWEGWKSGSFPIIPSCSHYSQSFLALVAVLVTPVAAGLGHLFPDAAVFQEVLF